MKNYIVKYAEVGPDAGPFTITDSTGAVVATGVTRAQLLAGYMVSINDTATGITVTSASPCGNSTVLEIPTAIGYYNFPGTTHKLTWVNDFQDLATASSAAGNATLGALAGYTIIQSASLATTGVLTVAGPSTTLGPFNGGGKVILTGSNSSTSGTVVESGAELQLGVSSKTGTTGSISGAMNVQGVLNMYGAYTAATQPTGLMTIGATGVVNIEGPDVCGQGYFTNGGAVTNNGVINIDNARWMLGSGGITGTTGVVNVLDGGTFDNNAQNVAAGNTFNIQGCGWCGTAYIDAIPLGAIHFQGTNTFASKINLVAPACMKTYAAATTISGQLTGNYPLDLGNSLNLPARYGSFSFTNNTNTYDSTITVTSTSLYNTGLNALAKADIVLANNGMFQQDGGTVNIGSLSSSFTNSTVLANGSVTINVRENGDTVYDGQFQNSTPGTPYFFNVYGPDTNQIKLTGAGSVMYLMSYGGAKIIAQSGSYELWNTDGGGTISAGNSKTTIIKNLYLKADAFLDVYAATGGGTGKITASNVAYLTAGWKVNIKDPLPAGTYDILNQPYALSNALLPTIGTNASGLTATFYWSGTVLKMQLA